MTDKALITLPKGTVPAKDDELFKEATTALDYFSRLQLMTSNSEVCKDGSFPPNHYALVRDQNYRDLGDSVNVLVIGWRPKAIEIDEQIITSFNPEDDEFQRIKEASYQKDSGCMYGPEFFVYVPSVKEYLTFFMGSKSSRREAPSMRALLLKAATLKSKKITTPSYTWFAPVVEKCATTFAVPPQEEIVEQYTKFMNEEGSKVKTVDEEDKSARDR